MNQSNIGAPVEKKKSKEKKKKKAIASSSLFTAWTISFFKFPNTLEAFGHCIHFGDSHYKMQCTIKIQHLESNSQNNIKILDYFTNLSKLVLVHNFALSS